jgi:hypothetical protein
MFGSNIMDARQRTARSENGVMPAAAAYRPTAVIRFTAQIEPFECPTREHPLSRISIRNLPFRNRTSFGHDLSYQRVSEASKQKRGTEPQRRGLPFYAPRRTGWPF